MGDKASISVGYVGNHGVHIPVYNQGLNAYMNPAVSGYNIAPFPTAAPTKVFANVQEYNSAGISNYNGLTASYSQRMLYGFTVQASYTWSHAMDEVSNGGIGSTPYNGTTSLVYQINPACLRCNNYGNADYDVRNSFNATYVWQMPYKFSNSFANAAFGNWTLSENFFVRSGLPLTVIDGNSFISNWTPSGGNNIQTVIAGNGQQSCVNGNSQCLNPAAFLNTAITNPTSFPNQRRNQFRGPGFFDSDVTIGKNFKITERVVFNFTTNFYNIFNHPNFTNPDPNTADGTFGQTTTTAAPPTGPYGSFFTGLPSGRIIQFAGKISF